ncbi:hypothetical protein JCM17380_24920 [Desulfosporosinus burensis]
MYLRRICRPEGQGFVVSHDPSNPMGLIIGSGSYGSDITSEAVSIEIPVSDVEQNVCITLQPDSVEPIHVVIARNYVEQPPLVATAIVLLANFWVPPNCSDLTTIDIFVRGFVADRLYETPFEEGKPVWERIG